MRMIKRNNFDYIDIIYFVVINCFISEFVQYLQTKCEK